MAYSPWRDLGVNWPQVEVRIADLPPGTLGEIRRGGRLIVVRLGTTAAQRRCTLTHEIVHLERGLPADLPPLLLDLEERRVEAEAARRLIPERALVRAATAAGADQRDIAAQLRVDMATLRTRLVDLDRRDPGWRRRFAALDPIGT